LSDKIGEEGVSRRRAGPLPDETKSDGVSPEAAELPIAAQANRSDTAIVGAHSAEALLDKWSFAFIRNIKKGIQFVRKRVEY